jgi:hypothetical protein
MSYTVLPHVATGDLATAALHNALLDDLLILKTSVLDDGRLYGELRNFREEIGTLTISSGTITLDLSTSNNFKVSLTANVTTITVSNWTASKAASVVLRLTQDGTGSRTVAFPSGWKWPGGSAPTMTATANKTDIVILWSDDGGTTIFASLFTVSA